MDTAPFFYDLLAPLVCLGGESRASHVGEKETVGLLRTVHAGGISRLSLKPAALTLFPCLTSEHE